MNNFGFEIPELATIVGVEVQIEKYQSANGDVIDNSIKLLKDGIITGNDYAKSGNWPSSDNDSYINYGGSSDLWGISDWTVEKINSSDFGVGISASLDGWLINIFPAIAYIDHIQINIYYEDPTLPVEFRKLRVQKRSGAVDLTWEIELEQASKIFTIERSSDFLGWEPVYSFSSKANREQNHQYSWSDLNPLPGNSFYRIRLSDYDGGVVYSKTVEYVNDLTFSLEVFPNPCTDELNITLNGPVLSKNEKLFVEVYSIDGTFFHKYSFVNQNIKINTRLYGQGNYYYLISSYQHQIGKGRFIVK